MRSRPNSTTLKPSFYPTINRGHPMAENLIGCVLLNEGNAIQMPREYVNSGRITLSGAPTWSPLRGSGAIRFPGTNDLITWPIPPTKANAAFSAMLIAEVEDTTVGNRKRGFRFFDTTNGSVAEIEFSDGGNNVICSGIATAPATFTTITNGPAYTANTPYVVGMHWKLGDKVRQYVNGFPNGVSAATASTMISGNNLTLGNNTAGGGLNVRGRVYLAYAWARWLDPSEFMELALNPYAFIVPKLIRRRMFVPAAAVTPTVGILDSSFTFSMS